MRFKGLEIVEMREPTFVGAAEKAQRNGPGTAEGEKRAGYRANPF